MVVIPHRHLQHERGCLCFADHFGPCLLSFCRTLSHKGTLQEGDHRLHVRCPRSFRLPGINGVGKGFIPWAGSVIMEMWRWIQYKNSTTINPLALLYYKSVVDLHKCLQYFNWNSPYHRASERWPPTRNIVFLFDDNKTSFKCTYLIWYTNSVET